MQVFPGPKFTVKKGVFRRLCYNVRMPKNVRSPYKTSSSDAIYAYNAVMAEHLKTIINGLFEKNIEVMLLKGAAFLALPDRDGASRKMGDADLLVRSEHFEDAKNVLTDLGYSFIHGNMQNEEVYGVISPVEIFIDLHRGLSNPSSPSQKKIYDPDMRDIWKRAVPVSTFANGAFVMSPEDELIYLSFHALMERFSNDKWLGDINTLILSTKDTLNRDLLLELAEKCEASKTLLLVADHIKNIFGTDLWIGSSPNKRFFLYNLEKSVFSFLAGPATKHLFPLRELLWLIAMDSLKKKASFLSELLAYIPRKAFRRLGL